jgi:hypothetical protein
MMLNNFADWGKKAPIVVYNILLVFVMLLNIIVQGASNHGYHLLWQEKLAYPLIIFYNIAMIAFFTSKKKSLKHVLSALIILSLIGIYIFTLKYVHIISNIKFGISFNLLFFYLTGILLLIAPIYIILFVYRSLRSNSIN